MSERAIVCVLGMHRSGTSLVARVLNVLGVDLGPEEHLMRPSSANPAGHWESRLVKDINDEILSRLGGSWWEPPAFEPGWESSPELAEPRRRARDLIAADFAGSDLWGFKDPRNSLTLPFWQRILDPMRYVICLRNPLDVAASLEAREVDSVPFEQGAELWLTYVRAALAATAGHPRQFVFYEDLMADPAPVVAGLARFVGHRPDAADPEARAAIRVALSEGLWHHRTPVPNVIDARRVGFHVKAFYLALRQFVSGPEAVGVETLELLATYAGDAGRRLAELADLRERSHALARRQVSLERRLSERRAKLERAVSERAEERRQLRAQLEQVESERDEEQRLRRRLEAELEAARAELSRLQEPPRREEAAPSPDPAPARPDYDRLVSEVRTRAADLIPSGATVLVAGKGDDALLRLNGSRGWHFPIAPDGRYAGYHPAGDTAAIAQLEALRARGADHLLLPATTLWWLDHYAELRRHLEDRYTPLLIDARCAIYRLSGGDRAQAGPLATLRRTIACLRIRSGRDPSILDWGTGLGIAGHFPDVPVLTPPSEAPVLPYLDGTIDVVAVAAADAKRLAEARRVAADAVITIDVAAPERTGLEWLAGGSGGWGDDVSVTLIPDADVALWEPVLGALAETVDDGFAGGLSVVGDSAALGAVSERAAGAGIELRPIEVDRAAGLARRARAAVESSDRRLQVFVTAPALPLPGWLSSIPPLLGSDRDAGVVATRILSRFGTLEEAGGTVAGDGRRERRGEGDPNPDRPQYRFVQRVDFCSPPLLATRRDVFERLDGFDQGLLTSAEATVDFSLRAGRAGAPVYYQPQARVVAIGDEDR